MKRSTIWVMLSSLIVAALVLSSCQPAATEVTEGQTIKGEVVQGQPAIKDEEVKQKE